MADFDAAMNLAREYREKSRLRGANDAEVRGIRETIDNLVGRFEGGRWTLPANVRRAMGLGVQS
jgi:hypothetical protein